MLYVCEMRVGVSISATTSVKRTSYGHLITQPQLPFGQRRPWDDRRIRSSFCFTPGVVKGICLLRCVTSLIAG